MNTDNELELYVHIPFCVKKCSYCDFLSAPADERTQKAYVAALLKEIQYYGPRFCNREVTTVYIGGGTPSWLQENYMELIMKQIRVSFSMNADTGVVQSGEADLRRGCEISIECNPGTLTQNKLETYRRAGINRLSIGLQSTMDDELQILGRIHTYDQFLRNYELARNCGFNNINIDLMSALPYQSVEKYMTSLKRVIALKPEHISAYSLIIEKGTPFYEKYKFDAVRREAGMKTEQLPSEETEYEIYKRTQELLAQNGYHHYEVSNYAKPGYECRHNIGYWKRTNYLGMGLGASSLIDNVRYTNLTKLEDYLAAAGKLESGIRGNVMGDLTAERVLASGKTVEVPCSPLHEVIEPIERKAQMEEFLFLGLRMTEGITRTEFYDTFGVQIEGVYDEVIRKLVAEDLLVKSAGQIRLTDKGNDISNYVLAQFLLD